MLTNDCILIYITDLYISESAIITNVISADITFHETLKRQGLINSTHQQISLLWIQQATDRKSVV